MATSTSSGFVPLVTEQPNGYDGRTQGQSGTEAGASGDSSSAMTLSSGGLIAIIIVVVVVSIVGAATATLFFIAKKREWTVRETIRRSARKVVTAMTPRRSEFPSSVKDQVQGGSKSSKSKSTRGTKPSISRSGYDDVEKAWPQKAAGKNNNRRS